MTIYDIVGDFYALKNLAQGAMTDPDTGEVRELSEEEKKDFLAWIEEHENNLETKMNNIFKVMKNKQAEAEVAEAERNALKCEMDRLSKKAKVAENEAQRIKMLFGYALDRLKIKKYKTPLFSVGYQNTRATAKEGFGFNPDMIPTEYLKRELSSSAINEAVKEGKLFTKDDDPLERGKLFVRGTGDELKGVFYAGGQTLVVR